MKIELRTISSLVTSTPTFRQRVHPTASRIASNKLFPTDSLTGVLSFSSACSTSSSGSSFKNGDGWQYTYTAEKIKGFKQTPERIVLSFALDK